MKVFITLLLASLCSICSQANTDLIISSDKELQIRNNKFSKSIQPIMNALSSGDIVGNGGGLAEQNFLFAYSNLGNIIASCIELDFCNLSQSELDILFKIQSISDHNINKVHNIVFLSENEAKDFFFDNHDKQIRTAKTGFSKDFPIFINLDLVYSKKSNLINDLASISAILIHEIGHQAGVLSHSALDSLSTTLRNFISMNQTSSSIKVFEYELLAKSYNPSLISERNLFSIEYGDNLFVLGKSIKRSLKCQNPKEKILSYKTSNTHWSRPMYVHNHAIIKIELWADINCMDRSGIIWPEQKDVQIIVKLSKDKKGSASVTEILIDSY